MEAVTVDVADFSPWSLGSYEEILDSSWDQVEGELCMCTFTVDEGITPSSINLHLDSTASNLDGDSNGYTFETVPKRVGAFSPDDDYASNQAVHATFSTNWSADMDYQPNGADIDGTWTLYATKLMHSKTGGTAGEYLDCEDIHPITFSISDTSTSSPAAPPAPQSSNGTEDGQDCTDGESHTTRARLVTVPGWSHMVPLPISGHEDFARTQITSISVTDWKGADQLRIKHQLSEVVLTPSSSSATLPTTYTWWWGSNIWNAERTADNSTFSFPEVDITYTCPTSSPVSPITRSVGYGLSLSELADAIDDLTATQGLGHVLVSATEDTWPVYAVRVRPVSTSGSQTHALEFEVRGTHAWFSIPLTSTGTNSWSFDFDSTDYSAAGTVTRGTDTLTIAVTSGGLTDGLTFTSSSITLDELATTP